MRKVSVVMATYNGERYLQEQLDTIVGQTYPIYELIVSDDHSTDNTWNILEDYASRYPFIRIVRHEGVRGINHNFFSAIRLASGDFIAISDQDDIWELNKIELQMKAIGEALLCSHKTKPFSENNLLVDYDSRVPNTGLLRVIEVSPCAGHSLLFRKELLEHFTPVDDCFFYDSQLVCVATALESLVFVNEVLTHHRRLLSSATVQKKFGNKISFSAVRQAWKLYRKHKPEMKKRAQVREKFLNGITPKTPAIQEGIRVSQLQYSSSFFDYLRLTGIYIRHRQEIFYTKESRPLIAFMRAVFFPMQRAIYRR